MNRIYLIVKEHRVLPNTIIDLRVILDDTDTLNLRSLARASDIEHSKLKEKYPNDYFQNIQNNYEIQHMSFESLADFCRDQPQAAALYIENKSSVEVLASEVLKGKEGS